MIHVSMSAPQLRRRECTIGCVIHRLRPMQHALLTTLLLHGPDRFTKLDTIIEALWPNPDLEPDCARKCVDRYMADLRAFGVLLENWHGNGWRIPAEGRGRYEPLKLAA